MNRLVLMHLALVFFLFFGCTASTPEPDLSAILSDRVEPSPSDEPERAEFDFGSVLARDQALRHEFRLANRSDRPLQLLRTTVKLPCCSSLGTIPKSIEPGGETIISVFLGHC